MNWENLRTCCCKALKHNQTECPVCGRKLIDQDVRPTNTGLKATLLIPFIALTLNSCDKENYESGIVKDKIENKIYVSPLGDTTTVYRIIDCNLPKGEGKRSVKNFYLNVNKGDTLVWYNYAARNYIVPVMSQNNAGGIIGARHYSTFNVVTLNGVRLGDLPNLLRKQELEQKAKQAQLEYEKTQRSR